MVLEDKNIVEGIHRGDHKVFRQVFDHFFQRLYLTSLKLVREQDVAEEIVHDVFVALWNRENPLELHTSFEAYVFRSVKNRSINHLKKRYVNTETALGDQFYHISDSDKSSKRAEMNELNALIQEGVNKMSETTRIVFTLSRFEELSYKEIADQLGCTVKNVEYHMGKSLKQLRTHLSKSGYLFLVMISKFFLE